MAKKMHRTGDNRAVHCVFCGAYSPKLKVTARRFRAGRVGCDRQLPSSVKYYITYHATLK